MRMLQKKIDERRPDVVCLQETKLADEAFAELLDDALSERVYEVVAYGETAWNVFFFSSRRRHTRFDCEWSSDVCSSDLHAGKHSLHHTGIGCQCAELFAHLRH